MNKDNNIVNHIILTRKELMGYATNSSLTRGEDLYQKDHILQVIVHLDRIEAIIQGSSIRRYRTIISWSDEHNEWNFKCSCPYDFGGLCKHEIALGLWMIDNCQYQQSTHEEDIRPIVEELNELYEKADVKIIRDFLFEQLISDEKLLKKFKSRVLELDTKSFDVPFNELVNELENIFKSIKLTPKEDMYDNLYSYTDEEYYRESWKMIEEIYKAEVGNYLEGIFDSITEMLDNGIYLKAIQYYCLMIEAYQNCVNKGVFEEMEPYSDYYAPELIEDYFTEQMGIITDRIYDISFSERIINEIYNFIKIRYLTIDKSILSFQLSCLLMMIKWSSEQAKEMLKCVRTESSISNPELLYYLADLTEDEELKTQICEDSVTLLKCSAEYLLNKYSDDIKEYYRIVETILSSRFTRTMLPGIFEKLSPDIDTELYCKVVIELYKITGDIQYYRTYKKYTSRFNYKEFVELLSPSLDPLKLFDIFIEEKEYEKAYDLFIKKLPNYSKADEYIAQLINNIPAKCFSYVTEKTGELLEIAISRDIYRKAGKLLVTLKMIKDDYYYKKGQQYIDEICMKYKMRPAMLDEFRKLGLI